MWQSRRRQASLAAVVVAFGCCSVPVAAAERAPASADVVENADFATLAGWRGHNSRLVWLRSGTRGGTARVVPRRMGRTFAIYRAPRPVASSRPREVYVAEARVRGHGRSLLCLRVRELAGRRVAASAQRCVRPRGEWRVVRLLYRARGGGRTIGLSVYASGGVRRAFDVDELALRRSLVAASGAVDASAAAAPERLYSPTSPFNTPIAAGARVDPSSSVMVQQLVGEVDANGWPIASGAWTNTLYYADAATPRYDVALRSRFYAGRALASVPIPDGAVVPGDDDGGMVVVDRHRGCAYDFGRAAKNPDGTWSAWFANALPLDTSGIYPAAESPSASGFANIAGTILPEELERGRIEHALAFTMRHTKAGGPVAPATGSDGWSTAIGAIPEGARLQLDPALDLDALGLTPWQRTIARALQEYGMYLVDTGGAVALRVQHRASTPRVYPWGDATYGQMPPRLARHLRVLELGPQLPITYRFEPNFCATLR